MTDLDVDDVLAQWRGWQEAQGLARRTIERVVSDLMRHASLQTTQGYTRPSDVQRSSAIDRLTLPGVQISGEG